jgi:hypothetical protein
VGKGRNSGKLITIYFPDFCHCASQPAMRASSSQMVAECPRRAWVTRWCVLAPGGYYRSPS